MKIFLIILILFFIILRITGCGKEEVENNTSQKETVSKSKTETQQQSSNQTKSNTPGSEVGKIWTQVEKINESMGKGINAGKSGHLEEPVAEIITLIKTIPEKSPNLDSTNLEVIKTKVNELRKTGIMMDRYQHDNKNSELKEEYAKFNSALNEIKKVLTM